MRNTGLKSRITAFFRENPDEELTHEIVATKFGLSIRSARRIVYILADAGYLEHVHVVRLKPTAKATVAYLLHG